MTRSEAVAIGATRYVGHLCVRHPQALGIRQTSNYTCVQCQAFRSAARQKTDKAKLENRAYRERNKDKLAAKERARKTDPLRRPAFLAYQRQYYAAKRKPMERARSAARRQSAAYNAKQIEAKRRWRVENREKHRATSRAYDARQLRDNLQRRLSKNLRHRLYKAVLGKTRGVSAVRDLGMSIAEFRNYIEAQFAPDMTWDNYGRSWHLDHKRPLFSFDLSNPDEARQACHFTNLQPLWALDNQRKHCHYSTDWPTKAQARL